MFVWEKSGKVWTIKNNQKKLMLDITEEVGSWRDFGLLGFALDPNFATNGNIYLLYTVDRHHLLHFGTSSYSSTTNDYFNATIGRVTRYTATATTTGYTVNKASRKILLGDSKYSGIPATHQSHGVGSLVFGTDGTLLISAGDGGSYMAEDTGSAPETYYKQALVDKIITLNQNVGAFRAQLLESYNGKILRINPTTGAGIPSNPFYDPAKPTSVRSKVWALGLRNPFRMTLGPGTGSANPADARPGTLFVGDVGNGSFEEINAVTRPGMNFGWPLYEGLTAQSTFPAKKIFNNFAQNPLYGKNGCTLRYFYFQDLIKQETASGTATFTNPCYPAQTIPNTIKTFEHSRPIIDWRHGTKGLARTGTFNGETATVSNIGAVGSPVAGSQFGGNSVTVGVFYPHKDFPAIYQNKLFFGDYNAQWIKSLAVDSKGKPVSVSNFQTGGAVVVAMAVNPTKAGIYYINYPSEIRKITYNGVNSPPTAVASADKTYGTSPLTVQFTGSKSTDPEGQALTYAWNFGDGTTSNTANPKHVFSTTTAIKYTVTLTVKDVKGSTATTTLAISVGKNTPPQVTITSPADNALYSVKQPTTYNLRATVIDKEQSNTQLSYKWQTILHHNDHSHAEPFDTARETTTLLDPIGCDGELYYYRIVLTVTDGEGLSGQDEVIVRPNCSEASNLAVNNTSTHLKGQTRRSNAALEIAKEQAKNTDGLSVYPAPTPDGRVNVNVTKAVDGKVTYTLVSLTGQKLTGGTLHVKNPTTTLFFNFSQEMKSAGIYYLLLENKLLQAKLKLMRQ